MQVINKNYEHINSSLPNWDTPKGVHVKNKDHYDRLMKENNMVSYDQMRQNCDNNGLKPFQLTDKARRILHIVQRDKKNGKVQMTTELINRMKEIGAINRNQQIPKYMMVPDGATTGGFAA